MIPKIDVSDLKLKKKSKEFKQALQKFTDQDWRLNNLYKILNDEGQAIPFTMNEAQKNLWENLHSWNLICKSRQLGFTTFIALYMLDTCLFTPNIETAIICHSREDASKILRRKIRYPYEHLPEMFKKKVRLVKDSESELQFSNGSVISTGTSARSGTLQILHISEFAKVCAKYPEKAREIVTGSLETLAPGQELFIESTAEGQQGYFYDYVQEAIKTQQDKRRKKLNKQEFRLHFFPWWKKPSNRLEMEEEVVFPVRLQEYYEDLEAKENIQLDREQKFWYMNAEKRLGDDIYREHPSTIEEPFKVAIEGSYFVREFNRIRREKRICSVPVEDGFEVQTAWDLGVNDTTAIWFFQMIGKEIRLVDYYENSGEGLAFYRDVLWEKNYRYGKHLGPHDLAVRELGTGKTRLETAQNLGIDFLLVPRTPSKSDAIQAARNILGQCWFDESRCLEGVQKLELYRKDWDERRGTWKNQPRHDENSHTADAFLTLAQGFDLVSKRKIVRPIKANSKKRWLAAVAG